MDNLLSKLSRLHVEEKRFTPEGSKEPIVYNVAVLDIQLAGKPSTIELKISKDKAQILQLADTVADNTL